MYSLYIPINFCESVSFINKKSGPKKVKETKQNKTLKYFIRIIPATFYRIYM